MSEFFNSDTWIIISVAIIAPVIGKWIHGWFAGKKKKVVNVVAVCPHCQADVGLEKVRNYICAACHGTVAFFDSLDGTHPKKELMFTCKNCGTDNFNGLKFCPGCKTVNPVE